MQHQDKISVLKSCHEKAFARMCSVKNSGSEDFRIIHKADPNLQLSKRGLPHERESRRLLSSCYLVIIRTWGVSDKHFPSAS